MQQLRIRDDVDLKELEKFGYRYIGNYNRGECWLKDIKIIIDNESVGGILIGEDRIIDYEFPYIKSVNYSSIIPFIKDLIQADVVEKVEVQHESRYI